jgi:hypothetical protein
LDQSMSSYFHKSVKKTRVGSAIVHRAPHAIKRSSYMEEQRLKYVERMGIKNEVYVIGKGAAGKAVDKKPKRIINFEDIYR